MIDIVGESGYNFKNYRFFPDNLDNGAKLKAGRNPVCGQDIAQGFLAEFKNQKARARENGTDYW